jgi:hypothetical protein
MTFALIINSFCKNNQALDLLLESLRVQPRWKTTPCYVVVGGHTSYSTTTEPDHVCINVPYNSYDYTAFLAVVEGKVPEADYYFYLHDTTVTGATFLDKLYAYLDVIVDKGYPAMRLRSPSSSMNIGFYKRTALLALSDFIRDANFVNPDLQRVKSFNVWNEDALFNKTPGCAEIPNGEPSVSDPVDYYKTGTLRRVESYPALDLKKIKANWDIKPVWELRL